MTTDITVRDYYLRFIYNSKKDKEIYVNKINVYKKYIKDIKNELKNNIIDYKTIFSINLSDYDLEWKKEVFNSKLTLYNKLVKLVGSEEINDRRVLLFQLIKYCNLLKNVYENKKLLEIADKRADMKYKDYQAIVLDYYTKVQKCLLEGMGYRFKRGTGVIAINRWKMTDTPNAKRILDYQATKLRKAELLKQGKKLYNENEAIWYEARNIPYDGVDYRIFKKIDCYYEFAINKSNVCKQSSIQFKHTEYVNNKHRGKSYKQMADECKNLNDILNYQVDIKYKLNMFLHKYPNKYLTYIRNAEQDRKQYRKNNS